MISASAEMYSHENEKFGSSVLFINDEGLGEMLVGRVVKLDPGMDHGLGNGSELKDSNAALAISSATETESLKKRKVDDDTHNLKVDSQEKYGDKKMKEFEEEDVSKITEQQNSNNKNNTTINAGATTNNNKKKGSQAVNSKVSDAAKPDYIHVRARRGQATDSHSLAERVRREKISERMRYLQELVPGCNKVIGKAGMLDEIINYVQSLQTQVEFLSMKLATINPGLEFDPHNYLAKEMFIPSCIAPNGLLPQPTDQFQFITFPQPNSTVALGKTTIPPAAAIQNTFMDSPSFNQLQQLTWDAELQNLYNLEYQQGRPPMFTSQPITGYVEEGHVKLEK